MRYIFLLGLFVLLSVSIVVADTGDEGGCCGGFGSWGMMGGSYGFGFMWVFGWLFMALTLVALVLFIIWLVQQLQRPVRRR